MDVAEDFGGLVPHIPGPATLGPAEGLGPTSDGVPRLRRLDPFYGWFTYYGDTPGSNPAVMFHPIPGFPFSLAKLTEVETTYPAQLTPEFHAVVRYATYRNGKPLFLLHTVGFY